MLPFIHILGRSVPSYGLSYSLAFIAAGAIAFARARRRGRDVNNLLIIAAGGILAGLICAKLAYLVFSYGIQNLLRDLRRGDFAVLADGGMVFYGGLLGGIGGAYLAVRLLREDMAEIKDIVVPTVPLAHAIGRVGCLCAGCCYGMPYAGPLCLRFPHSIAGLSSETAVFPVQPLESVVNLAIFGALLLYTRRRPRGRVLSVYLTLYALSRFGLEFLRGDAVRGGLWGVSASQWISLALLAAVLLAGLRSRRA